MELTREHYRPTLDWPEISYAIWHRYLYASQFAPGKVVLDVASGDGYGSDHLAEVAQRVVAIGSDPEVVKNAAEKYRRSNLEFHCGSAEAIPLEGRHLFDVAVCFATVEHFDKVAQEKFLREIERLLKPDGLLLVSTASTLIASNKPCATNPFHCNESYVDGYLVFLKRCFRHVHLLGQKVYPASVFWPLTGPSQPVREYQLAYSGERYEPIVNDQKDALYQVAVCSNRDFGVPSGSMLIHISERATRPRQIQRLALDAEANPRAMQEMRRTIEEQAEQVNVLTARVEFMSLREQDLRELLLDAHDQLRHRDQEIEKSVAAAFGQPLLGIDGANGSSGSLLAAIENQQCLAAELRQQTLDRDAEREELVRIIDDLHRQIQEHGEEQEAYHRTLAELRQNIEQLQEEHAERQKVEQDQVAIDRMQADVHQRVKNEPRKRRLVKLAKRVLSEFGLADAWNRAPWKRRN